MSATVLDQDSESKLVEIVGSAICSGSRLNISGGNTKSFYGYSTEGEPLSTAHHTGVVSYDPSELVMTVRAGTSLKTVEALLAEENQQLTFEPPHFGEQATIGGAIACGLSGPRRAYSGSIRDTVLGVKMIDGRGQVMRFGGQVIKNVAGFDVSRLMVGSFGTLGILLEISIRVMPRVESEMTIEFQHDTADKHIAWVNQLAGSPIPLSATFWSDGISRIRLSGSFAGVESAFQSMGGEPLTRDESDAFWCDLKEHKLAFFDSDQPVWKISLPSATPDRVKEHQIIEWGGAQRWLLCDSLSSECSQAVSAAGGHCIGFRHTGNKQDIFPNTSAEIGRLQSLIKTSFDPHGVFNIGRMYKEV